jgi:CRISPR-associated endonuclease Csn1
MENYRLALDLGTNSIGWCAYALEKEKDVKKPASIMDMGVRIFPDGRNPKDGSSNAEERRGARSMRRNHDRFIGRRNRLLKVLAECGLMPEAEEGRRQLCLLDPYALRVRGLEEELTPYELGRALFHLNQRRGFKSNRKSDAKESDTGIIKTALQEQREKIRERGARTFGEFLYLRREEGRSTRSRLHTRTSVNEKGKEKEEEYYEIYPARDDLEYEFDFLWQQQARYHADLLSDNACDKIKEIIFYQRPLKAPPIGRCTFERGEERAPKALPAVQMLRIYQELNHLQVIDPKKNYSSRPLTLEERDTLAMMLTKPKGRKKGNAEIAFKAMRKKLKLGAHTVFSHESEKRTKLEGDTTTALMTHEDRFGKRWYDISDEEQERIVLRLLHEPDEEKLIKELMAAWDLDRDHAEAVACTPLPDKHGRLGITATNKVLRQLTREVIPYSEAVVRAGYKSHSQFASGEARNRLPYYGEVLERHVVPDPEWEGHPAATLDKRFGKVTNPTVHIAMNQLRKVVNEVIKLHGKPAEINIEVLRELKNSLEIKKEINKKQAENQRINDECADRLRNEFDLPVNRDNIQRLRLWMELGSANQVCVYTGENISANILFTDEIEIDHILPFSRTFDDSMGNKVLCIRRANRDKSNQTPFEAWGETDRWTDILERSKVLPGNKRWRFGEDAMERFLKDNDFIARQLTDTQYIARLARAYLACLYPAGQEHRVGCIPGRLTGMFRHNLGLNDLLDEINPARKESNIIRGEKNRADHRNHTVDALVVGLMDRVFLKRAATLSAREDRASVNRMLEGFGEPWPGFRAEAKEALAKVIVSHKPDHGIAGELHNDTAYGFSKADDPRGNAVHRVNVSAITTTNLLNIRGRGLRAELLAHIAGITKQKAAAFLADLEEKGGRGKDPINKLCGAEEKETQKRILTFFQDRGIRHVRLIERIAVVPIRDQQGKPFKGFKTGGNAYLDLYEKNDGTWIGNLVSTFIANAIRIKKVPEDYGAPEYAQKRVMRLFNRDMIELEHEGKRRFCYIQKMSRDNNSGKIRVYLTEHFEANAASRNSDNTNPFKFIDKSSIELLQKSKVRFLVVTPAGRVRYLSDDPDDTARG